MVFKEFHLFAHDCEVVQLELQLEMAGPLCPTICYAKKSATASFWVIQRCLERRPEIMYLMSSYCQVLTWCFANFYKCIPNAIIQDIYYLDLRDEICS